MKSFIAESANGALFCSETKQKFGESFYTLCLEKSDRIDLLLGRASTAKSSNSAGIKNLMPTVLSKKELNMEKLEALINGKVFPGSKINTKDVLKKTMDINDLMAWKALAPELFDQFFEKKKEKPVVEEKPEEKGKKSTKKAASSTKAATAPEPTEDDPFGEIE